MITPRQAAELAADVATNPVSPVKQFEWKIDAALERAALEDRWPVTIALTGVSAGIRRMFETEYRKAGWRAEIVYDQRDGDYLQIGKPEAP